MRRKIKNFFIPGKRFKKEFKRQARMLIIITLGFTIAFTWRQTIFDLSESLVKYILHIEHSFALSVIASTFITAISILVIYLASYYLKDSNENY